MRVLVLQTLYETSRDLSGLSEWNHHLDIVRSLARRGKRVFFYIAVPRRTDEILYADDLFDLPNVKVLPYGFRGYYLMPDEWPRWLSVNTNSVPFDAVWNGLWWHNAVIATLLRSGTVGESPLLVNLFHEGVRAPEVIAHSGLPLVDLTILGGALQGRLVVLTEHQHLQLREIARSYLGGSALRSLEDVDVLCPAVDLGLVDRHRQRFDEERRNRSELVVYLAGGLVEAKRRFVEIARVVKRLSDRGFPIRLLVRTQSPASSRRGVQLEELGAEIEYECPRQRHLEGLGDADVTVEASTDEVTGLSNAEAVLSGLVCIAVRQPWMRGRIPDWYELAVSGWSEVEVLLAAMCRDKERFRVAARRLEAHYRDRLSSDRVADRFVGILEKLRAGKRFRVSRSFMELVEKSVEGKDEISLPGLYREMRQHARNEAVDWSRGRKYWNGFLARRALESCGFVDLCDGEEPVFVRESRS